MAFSMTYTVDEDAIEEYMGNFAYECDIAASAARLAEKIEANMERYYPEFAITIGHASGPLTRPLEVDANEDTDDWREAIGAMIDDLWQDGNVWVVDKSSRIAEEAVL